MASNPSYPAPAPPSAFQISAMSMDAFLPVLQTTSSRQSQAYQPPPPASLGMMQAAHPMAGIRQPQSATITYPRSVATEYDNASTATMNSFLSMLPTSARPTPQVRVGSVNTPATAMVYHPGSFKSTGGEWAGQTPAMSVSKSISNSQSFMPCHSQQHCTPEKSFSSTMDTPTAGAAQDAMSVVGYPAGGFSASVPVKGGNLSYAVPPAGQATSHSATPPMKYSQAYRHVMTRAQVHHHTNPYAEEGSGIEGRPLDGASANASTDAPHRFGGADVGFSPVVSSLPGGSEGSPIFYEFPSFHPGHSQSLVSMASTTSTMASVQHPHGAQQQQQSVEGGDSTSLANVALRSLSNLTSQSSLTAVHAPSHEPPRKQAYLSYRDGSGQPFPLAPMNQLQLASDAPAGGAANSDDQRGRVSFHFRGSTPESIVSYRSANASIASQGLVNPVAMTLPLQYNMSLSQNSHGSQSALSPSYSESQMGMPTLPKGSLGVSGAQFQDAAAWQKQETRPSTAIYAASHGGVDRSNRPHGNHVNVLVNPNGSMTLMTREPSGMEPHTSSSSTQLLVPISGLSEVPSRVRTAPSQPDGDGRYTPVMMSASISQGPQGGFVLCSTPSLQMNAPSCGPARAPPLSVSQPSHPPPQSVVYCGPWGSISPAGLSLMGSPSNTLISLSNGANIVPLTMQTTALNTSQQGAQQAPQLPSSVPSPHLSVGFADSGSATGPTPEAAKNGIHYELGAYYEGIVKRYHPKRGFGFLTATHRLLLREGFVPAMPAEAERGNQEGEAGTAYVPRDASRDTASGGATPVTASDACTQPIAVHVHVGREPVSLGDIFVHQSNIQVAGFRSLEINSHVRFRVGTLNGTSHQATEVNIIARTTPIIPQKEGVQRESVPIDEGRGGGPHEVAQSRPIFDGDTSGYRIGLEESSVPPQRHTPVTALLPLSQATDAQAGAAPLPSVGTMAFVGAWAGDTVNFAARLSPAGRQDATDAEALESRRLFSRTIAAPEPLSQATRRTVPNDSVSWNSSTNTAAEAPGNGQTMLILSTKDGIRTELTPSVASPELPSPLLRGGQQLTPLAMAPRDAGFGSFSSSGGTTSQGRSIAGQEVTMVSFLNRQEFATAAPAHIPSSSPSPLASTTSCVFTNCPRSFKNDTVPMNVPEQLSRHGVPGTNSDLFLIQVPHRGQSSQASPSSTVPGGDGGGDYALTWQRLQGNVSDSSMSAASLPSSCAFKAASATHVKYMPRPADAVSSVGEPLADSIVPQPSAVGSPSSAPLRPSSRGHAPGAVSPPPLATASLQETASHPMHTTLATTDSTQELFQADIRAALADGIAEEEQRRWLGMISALDWTPST